MYGGGFREQTAYVEFQVNRLDTSSLTNFGNGASTIEAVHVHENHYVIHRSKDNLGRTSIVITHY